MEIRYHTRFGLLALLLLVGACTNQAWYNGIQQHQQLECSKLPGSQYEKCMQEVSQPYAEYEREYQALKEDSAQADQVSSPAR
ncbi:MAG: hypothetical protein AAGF57_05195 [Pseudomonadota bacterium]